MTTIALRRGGRTGRLSVRAASDGSAVVQRERRPFEANDVVVVACGMLAREIEAVRKQLGLHHLRLRCLPAAWHFQPERIADGVRDAVLNARISGARSVFVAYADCGTGGALDAVCAELQVERIPGPHCFAFYQNEQFDGESDDLDAFYVTDFLARQPDAFLWKPLGLDRAPELRDSYFAHYQKVVYLAQTNDANLLRSAQGIANRLGLNFEHRSTGYGALNRYLPTWNAMSGSLADGAPSS